MKYQYDVQVQSSTGEWENINMQSDPIFLKIADALSEDGLIKIVIREGAEDGPDVDEHLVIPAGLGAFIMEHYDIMKSLGNETYQVVKK